MPTNDTSPHSLSSISHPAPSLHPSRRPAALNHLPPELLLKIFSHLDPANSTCLGLSCKRLYQLHRSLHGSVRLETRCHTAHFPAPGPKLYELLEEWYGPGFEMCWCGHLRVRTARVNLGLEPEGVLGRARCVKCRIAVFSKPQLKVKVKWLHQLPISE